MGTAAGRGARGGGERASRLRPIGGESSAPTSPTSYVATAAECISSSSLFFDALISTLPRCDGGPELRSPAADGGRDPEREPTEGRAAAPGGGFLRTAVDGFRGAAAVAAVDGLRGAGAAAAADGLRAAVAVDGLRAAVDVDDATEAPRDGARAADDAAERADGLPVEPHVSDSASLFACGDVARGAADDDAPPPGFTDGRRPPAGAVAPTLLRRRSGDAPLDATELPLGRR